MKFAVILSAGALAVAAVAVAAMPVQDAKAKSRPDDKANAGAAMDPAAMHAQMMELGKPGPEQAQLKKMVGTWQIACKSWEGPGEPQLSTGTSTIEMVNDRFLIEKFSGEFPGMGHYEGTGTMGFNNATKEFEHVWRDNFNSGMMWSTGTRGADGSVTLTGKSHCPMGEMSCRSVSKMMGDNAFHFEMYGTMAGMPEMKMMEMDYTRK
jgi:hypothetical protein